MVTLEAEMFIDEKNPLRAVLEQLPNPFYSIYCSS